MTNFRVQVISHKTIARVQRIINSLSTSEEYLVDFTDDENLYEALGAKVNVAILGVSKYNNGVTS